MRAAPVRRIPLSVLLLSLSAGPAWAADPLIADLSSREIAITTGFTGTELLLFGAVDGPGDVVVVVRGPKRREIVRRKERIGGVWVNADSMLFDDVPTFYRVASARPLSDIASESALARRELGTDRLKFTRVGPQRPDEPAFRRALLRNKNKGGLYSDGQGELRVIGNRLFRTAVDFPASVSTGTYSVDVHLFRDGRIIDTQQTPLSVRKVGLEADIYNFAHQQAAFYGMIAIVIALMAGWIAGVVFRRS